MARRKTASTMRKLNDTSWLAQTIRDKMEVEFDECGDTIRYHCLHTLLIIVREADNPENTEVYYSGERGKRSIVICDIKPQYQYGTDFDLEGMQAKLRGLAERYKDNEGMYIVNVLTTHDLNSATVADIEELLYQMAT